MKAAVGLAVVVWFLAIGAAIPGVAFVVLGYLLTVEGRIARGGRFTAAFPALDVAPRAGLALAVGWLCVLPMRLLWAATLDARVVNPGGTAASVLLGLTVGAGLGAAAVVWVTARWALPPSAVEGRTDGRASSPSEVEGRTDGRDGRTGGRDGGTDGRGRRTRWGAASLDFARGTLALGWLGLRGFAGALVWLAVPAVLWIAARAGEHPRPGLAIVGGLVLVPVLAWLPFLQARFAAEPRFRALFEWRQVRAHFRRAPLAFLLALVLTYALTFPLYLLKVVLPPRDAAWLVTIVFVATVLPVRISLGWAWRRAARATNDASRWLLGPVRVLLVAFLAAYAVLLFLAPLVDAHGTAALLSHHAFLLPSPF